MRFELFEVRGPEAAGGTAKSREQSVKYRPCSIELPTSVKEAHGLKLPSRRSQSPSQPIVNEQGEGGDVGLGRVEVLVLLGMVTPVTADEHRP